MKELKIQIKYKVYDDIHQIQDEDRKLLNKASAALPDAYAPYSKFHVAAAILLDDGKIITGTNQENASFPVGICAERVALSAVSAVYPNKKIKTIAIAVKNFNNMHSLEPATPCGVCRQALFEKESNNINPIKILTKGEGEMIYEFASAKDLLPLGFGAKNLL
jgi:cytidine deaminase